jgi:phosphopentomutase
MTGRAFLVVLDSAGIGGARDGDQYFNGDLPDIGANTIGHIAQACAQGRANDGRSGPLHMPHLAGLGLGAALELASGLHMPDLHVDTPCGLWGVGDEISKGKDTPSGHWELAGVPIKGRAITRPIRRSCNIGAKAWHKSNRRVRPKLSSWAAI